MVMWLWHEQWAIRNRWAITPSSPVILNSLQQQLFLHALFWTFWKNIWKSKSKQRRFTNLKIIIAKCDRYCKLRQNLLKSVTGITKCDMRLLQSIIGIKRCNNYYKMRRKILKLSSLQFSMRRGNCVKYTLFPYKHNLYPSSTNVPLLYPLKTCFQGV